jgi:hypothetical protein
VRTGVKDLVTWAGMDEDSMDGAYRRGTKTSSGSPHNQTLSTYGKMAKVELREMYLDSVNSSGRKICLVLRSEDYVLSVL